MSSTCTRLWHRHRRHSSHQPVMACIGPCRHALHQGVLDVWDRADSAFVSAYRKHHDAGFDIEIEYLGAPAMEGRALVLIDPMLATGASLQNDAQNCPGPRARRHCERRRLGQRTAVVARRHVVHSGRGRSRPQRARLHRAWVGGCGRLGVWTQDAELSPSNQKKVKDRRGRTRSTN